MRCPRPSLPPSRACAALLAVRNLFLAKVVDVEAHVRVLARCLRRLRDERLATLLDDEQLLVEPLPQRIGLSLSKVLIAHRRVDFVAHILEVGVEVLLQQLLHLDAPNVVVHLILPLKHELLRHCHVAAILAGSSVRLAAIDATGAAKRRGGGSGAKISGR